MKIKTHISGLFKEIKNLNSEGQYDTRSCGNIFITKELTRHSLHLMWTRKVSQRE